MKPSIFCARPSLVFSSLASPVQKKVYQIQKVIMGLVMFLCLKEISVLNHTLMLLPNQTGLEIALNNEGLTVLCLTGFLSGSCVIPRQFVTFALIFIIASKEETPEIMDIARLDPQPLAHPNTEVLPCVTLDGDALDPLA